MPTALIVNPKGRSAKNRPRDKHGRFLKGGKVAKHNPSHAAPAKHGGYKAHAKRNPSGDIMGTAIDQGLDALTAIGGDFVADYIDDIPGVDDNVAAGVAVIGGLALAIVGTMTGYGRIAVPLAHGIICNGARRVRTIMQDKPETRPAGPTRPPALEGLRPAGFLTAGGTAAYVYEDDQEVYRTLQGIAAS